MVEIPATQEVQEKGFANYHSPYSLILPPHVEDDVKYFLKQDVPNFDMGAYAVGDSPCVAQLLAKSDGLMAGIPFFDMVFKHLGCTVTWGCKEGTLVGPSQVPQPDVPTDNMSNTDSGSFDATSMHFKGRHVVAKVRGPVNRVLQGERTALNILSRTSGIATETRALVNIKNAHGWHGEIAATRKVTPGFRLFEKYAVIVGGGVPHRMDLSDMTMLKDNHIWACGKSIDTAVRKVRDICGFSNKIEVECQTLQEAREAAQAGAEIVMLDNFPPVHAKDAAKMLKNEFPRGLTIEVSGGLDTSSAPDYFSEHVDVLSFGRLTHGYDIVDFSLKIMSEM